MLGLVLIYFLGKSFYQLAQQYDKSPWGYAVLGVISYYAGTFIAGILLVILMEINSAGSIDDTNEFVLGLVALPFGLLCAWGLYKFLENRFEGNVSVHNNINSDILDEDMI